MRTQRKPAAASISISPGRGSVKWMFTPTPSGTTGLGSAAGLRRGA